jgi:hypothetical protein
VNCPDDQDAPRRVGGADARQLDRPAAGRAADRLGRGGGAREEDDEENEAAPH